MGRLANRGRSGARKAIKRPKKRLLLVVEGLVTEREYFNALGAELHAIVELDVPKAACGGEPKTLVMRAIKEKHSAERDAKKQNDNSLLYDEVWCICDGVGEHMKLPEAKIQARASDVKMAVSEPCFELWALLHFQAQTAELHRTEARAKLKKHVPKYDKHLPFIKMKPHMAVAKERARSLRSSWDRLEEPGKNPSTDVDLVVDAIRQAATAEDIDPAQS